MKEAFRLTRKDGAPSIDGVTAAGYAQNLEANLSDLLERIKSGRYQAPPVRRVYIPKGDGAGSLRAALYRCCSASHVAIISERGLPLSAKKWPPGFGPFASGNTTNLTVGTREPGAVAEDNNV